MLLMTLQRLEPKPFRLQLCTLSLRCLYSNSSTVAVVKLPRLILHKVQDS